MMELMDMKLAYWTKTWVSNDCDCRLTGVTHFSEFLFNMEN